MSPVGSVLYLILFVFFILIIARVVMEWVFVFARSYQPRGVALVLLELVYTITDPPVKALRRVIPPLRLGGVALDLSVTVLLLVVIILMQLVRAI